MDYRSPAMSGGLLAVKRDYFKELGEYDEGMEIWGAENIEFSLRVRKEIKDQRSKSCD